ncbi:LysR family transcriptional regulator [Pseudarthrobacter sp. P1]|uniref:LysR family transcriptional regulator n=1 Tax=Pseudarthrobacter sp. P1 TaxID=3418418 RepID=UPI003CED918D
MLDIRKLRMLTELDRLGTLSAVAAALHLSAPGVSMQIAALERETGLPLTERQGRNVVLTPAGKLLADHGRDILDQLAVAGMEAEALKQGSSGVYRLAAFASAARTVVARAYARILGSTEAYPTLRLVELEPQDALPALAAGEVDAAITHAYSNTIPALPAGVFTVLLGTEPVLLAARADHPAPPAGAGPVDLGLLARSDWIIPNRQWACYDMVERACSLAGYVPRPVAEATDFATQLALVSAGVGVALVPALAVASLPSNVLLRPLAQPVRRSLYLARRTSARADAGSARLAELLADAAQEAISAAVNAVAPQP